MDANLHEQLHSLFGFHSTLDHLLTYLDLLVQWSDYNDIDTKHITNLKRWLYNIKPILEKRLNSLV